MRLVLDTNVVASAMLWGGVPHRLLQARHERRIELYTSAPMLAELTDILTRAKFARKIAGSMLSVDELVERYAELVQVVRPGPIARTAPDVDDDVVIATALAAQANWLVTGDRALRSVERCQDVRIISVAEALEALAANR